MPLILITMAESGIEKVVGSAKEWQKKGHPDELTTKIAKTSFRRGTLFT